MSGLTAGSPAGSTAGPAAGSTASARGMLRQVLDFARSVEPAQPLSRRAQVVDAALAILVLAGGLAQAGFHNRIGILVAIGGTVPLATRRRYPLGVFGLLLFVLLVGRYYVTYLSFLALVIAAYTAVVRSRLRGAAILSVIPAGFVVAIAFWSQASALHPAPRFLEIFPSAGRRAGALVLPFAGGPAPPPGGALIGGPGVIGGNTPWRLAVLLVLVSLVSIAVVGAAVQASDRIRKLKAEHEAATKQALELERARIASELHDVVTHNVSVMIIQAGAARQVLADAPDDARSALLAVEASGRSAMTELRHLLGLLTPTADLADEAGEPAELRPQPGLAQLPSLLDGVVAAGLPVELADDVAGRLAVLPAGVDLAAFRVVQEALTNVIRHAGKPATFVRLGYAGGNLVVEVANDSSEVPLVKPAAGSGRGLVGLRERVVLYGGELDAGPRPGGGWRVRAKIPVDGPVSIGVPVVPASLVSTSERQG